MLANDERQLSVLATLHYAYGVLLGIGALLMLMVLVGGIRMELRPAFEPSSADESLQQLSGGMIWILTGALGFVLQGLLAAATMRAARGLETQTRRSWCMVVAAFNSLAVPLGTVLGIVTIVTLMRPSVIQLFNNPT